MTATAALSPSISKAEVRSRWRRAAANSSACASNERGPFQFILDTGAGTSLVSSELAKELQLKSSDRKKVKAQAEKLPFRSRASIRLPSEKSN